MACRTCEAAGAVGGPPLPEGARDLRRTVDQTIKFFQGLRNPLPISPATAPVSTAPSVGPLLPWLVVIGLTAVIVRNW